jgi:hypothetical protein
MFKTERDISHYELDEAINFYETFFSMDIESLCGCNWKNKNFKGKIDLLSDATEYLSQIGLGAEEIREFLLNEEIEVTPGILLTLHEYLLVTEDLEKIKEVAQVMYGH